MMVIEPIMRNQYYKLGRSHFVCCFTLKTLVHEITTVDNDFIPIFPNSLHIFCKYRVVVK
jgi:hypothetical protein